MNFRVELCEKCETEKRADPENLRDESEGLIDDAIGKILTIFVDLKLLFAAPIYGVMIDFVFFGDSLEKLKICYLWE